jgi:TPR repeat protein
MAIQKGHVTSIYNYAFYISKGLYGEQGKKESEQYYLMVIQQGDVKSMFIYANKLSEGLYGEHKKNESDVYLKMYYLKK